VLALEQESVVEVEIDHKASMRRAGVVGQTQTIEASTWSRIPRSKRDVDVGEESFKNNLRDAITSSSRCGLSDLVRVIEWQTLHA
jgi:hypothetical protein